MPTFSYLVTPQSGQRDQLVRKLSQFRYCEVIPAENDELVILITETPDEEAEKQLKDRLDQLSTIQHLSMAFGHSGEVNPS